MKNFTSIVCVWWLLVLAVILLSCLAAPVDGFHRMRTSSGEQHKGVRRFAGTRSLRKSLRTGGGGGEEKSSRRRTRTEDQINPLQDVTSTDVSDVLVDNPTAVAAESKKQMVWLNFTEANREILQLIHKKYGYKNEKLMIKKRTKMDKNEQRQKMCHSIAMLQCGCNALTSFEMQLNSSENIAFSKKCEIREKFFKCLDGAAAATCRHANRRLVKPKSAFKQRMREIVRVLWTTRGCILGTDDSSQSLKDLNINSRFCSSFHNHHKASKRSRPSGGGVGVGKGGGKGGKAGKSKKGDKRRLSDAEQKQQPQQEQKAEKRKSKNKSKAKKLLKTPETES